MPNQFRYPIWQEPYLAAMIEMDSIKMKGRIAFAEDAIRVRMIAGEPEPGERQAILDALNALKFIKH